MTMKAESGRSAFTFGRRGLTAKVPLGPIPHMDGEALNRNISVARATPRRGSQDPIRGLENFLARYFAHGRRQAA